MSDSTSLAFSPGWLPKAWFLQCPWDVLARMSTLSECQFYDRSVFSEAEGSLSSFLPVQCGRWVRHAPGTERMVRGHGIRSLGTLADLWGGYPPQRVRRRLQGRAPRRCFRPGPQEIVLEWGPSSNSPVLPRILPASVQQLGVNSLKPTPFPCATLPL